MAALIVLVIAAVTFILTISLVVIGQEIHPIAAIVLFAVLCYGAYWLFKQRLTKL